MDFDLTKLRGVAFDVDGVLSPATIPMSAEGEPLRMVNIKDGYAIQLAVKQGLEIAIITGGNTRAVKVRYECLGVQHVCMGAATKLPALERWLESRALKAGEVAFVGDDIPDIPAMRAVGLAVAPADAAPEVKAVAGYVSPCCGGHGVARDMLERVMRAKGLWMADLKAFGW